VVPVREERQNVVFYIAVICWGGEMVELTCG